MAITPERVIYHTAWGPAIEIAGRDAQAQRQIHLVSYDLNTGAFTEHGALMAGDRRVLLNDCLDVGPRGTLYALAFIEVTHPVKAWLLKSKEAHGVASYWEIRGVPFEMELIAIGPETTAWRPKPKP